MRKGILLSSNNLTIFRCYTCPCCDGELNYCAIEHGQGAIFPGIISYIGKDGLIKKDMYSESCCLKAIVLRDGTEIKPVEVQLKRDSEGWVEC